MITVSVRENWQTDPNDGRDRALIVSRQTVKETRRQRDQDDRLA
jgi:hypothetical protein